MQRAVPARGGAPLPVAPLSVPVPAAPLELPAAQRFPSFGFGSGSGSGSGRSIGALAAAASASMASTLGHLRPSAAQAAPPGPPPPYEPPPAYSGPPPSGPAPSVVRPAAGQDDPPGYTEVPAGAFDPRQLTEFQLDALVHRIIDRVTRLVRAELRMDRERIGRLRDPRA
ncbi:hypothetical protein [Streptomyces sp. NPDC059708]|uniref:hypothetical protein n=1 Tax=Streptomyces sp. NPDC059708 TaxID=3346916 RepID=UPI0036776ECF